MKTFTKTTVLVAFTLFIFATGVSNTDNGITSNSIAQAYEVDPGYGDPGCCGGEGTDTPPSPPPPPPDPDPTTCQYLNSDITTLPFGGGAVSLSWASTNANSATLTPIGSSVAVNKSGHVVNITSDTTFVLQVSGAGGSDSCQVSIDVLPEVSELTCQDMVFTASDSIVTTGETVNLAWVFTGNVDSASIDQGIGDVWGSNNTNVVINNDITYTMTIANSANQVSCPLFIAVEETTAITCANNVTFTSSDYSLPRGGGSVTLTWVTTGLDSLSINGVASTNLSDSEVVQVGADAVYTLTAYSGSDSVSCPLSIDVATGGGGGGSSKPRCDLDISDSHIKKGETITLTWNTTRAKEVKITDNHGNILLDSNDRDDFDGSMKIKPTEDTEYTLLSKRGTRERTCEIEVEVENTVTVLETRTHDPLVAGISLTQVPYTGFEAGPTLTLLFYALLTIWGLFVAYVLVVRRDSIGNTSLAGAHDNVSFTDLSVEATQETRVLEFEDYVQATVADSVPADLPIATPVVGYDAVAAEVTEDETDESIEMTELENRAHAQRALLSSDAMRFFMNATPVGETRNEKLDSVIAKAKTLFPSEDGWIVLNLARIDSLITDKKAEVEVDTEIEVITGGSLAEAIVTGNIVAAYQMIAHRPMIALADAASDLDAVYRSRKGEEVHVSNMLATSAEVLSESQLEAAIAALTSAVDGTYDSEESAVKMAIMKAAKAVA